MRAIVPCSAAACRETRWWWAAPTTLCTATTRPAAGPRDGCTGSGMGTSTGAWAANACGGLDCCLSGDDAVGMHASTHPFRTTNTTRKGLHGHALARRSRTVWRWGRQALPLATRAADPYHRRPSTPPVSPFFCYLECDFFFFFSPHGHVPGPGRARQRRKQSRGGARVGAPGLFRGLRRNGQSLGDAGTAPADLPRRRPPQCRGAGPRGGLCLWAGALAERGAERGLAPVGPGVGGALVVGSIRER